MEQLGVLDLIEFDLGRIHFRQINEEGPIFPLLLAQGKLGLHVDRFPLRLLFVLDGASLEAEGASCAFLGFDLERVNLLLELLKPRRGADLKVSGAPLSNPESYTF